MSKVVLPRTCRECGCTFQGGPRAWYCPSCREDRKRIQDRDFKARKRVGSVVPVGSVLRCERCGKEIIKNGGLQRFCPECAAQNLKIIDNAQSLKWKMEHPEKDKEAKRNMSKRRSLEDGKSSGIKYISWDKGSRKWRVAPVINGHQVYGGKYKDIESAQKALDRILRETK